MDITQAQAQYHLGAYHRVSQKDREEFANRFFIHEHPLEPWWTSSGLRDCDACGNNIPVGSRLRCKACDFDLHHDCSAFLAGACGIVLKARAAVARSPTVYRPVLPTKLKHYEELYQGKKEELVNIYFIHDHTMKLEFFTLDSDLECRGCGMGSSGPWYVCGICGFRIHRKCSAAVALAYALRLNATKDRGFEKFLGALLKELIKHSLLHMAFGGLWN